MNKPDKNPVRIHSLIRRILRFFKQDPDKQIIKPSRMVLKPGKNIGNDEYDLILSTVDTSVETKLNKTTKEIDITGTYGFWPTIPGPVFVIKALWDLLMSFGGRMDVVVTNRANDIAISINNPTIGYPYAVFVEWSTNRSERHDYYVNESFEHTDSHGRVYTITRHEDSEGDVAYKEWTVMVNN